MTPTGSSRSAAYCRIAPSAYYTHAARRADPSRASAGNAAAALCVEIEQVWEENFQVYGVRKVWRQLKRETIEVARCTVARLMRQMGLRGAVRGKAARTTISDRSTPCPADRVNQQFGQRANALWVSDFTYVATWQGFVYVAFVIGHAANTSSAGGSPARRAPTSCSMPSNRRYRAPPPAARRPHPP